MTLANTLKLDLRSMDLTEIGVFFHEIGEKSFRAKQVFEWINKKNAFAFSEMTNISHDLQNRLSESATLSDIRISDKQESEDVIKYLFEFSDEDSFTGEVTKFFCETVLMRYKHGNSICLSTQFGCRMGCKFCASTVNGLERNMTTGEIAAQVYLALKDSNEKISNIVLMGCGEPFDNYSNVVKFIRLINSPDGANIGQRHITLSTCGIVEKIYDLLHENLQITLAVSLHAPNDGIRQSLMPVAKKYKMTDLLEACKAYADNSRRVTFEYALIEGVNDTYENARELAFKLKHMLCHINLIPVNEVFEREFKASSKNRVSSFAEVLEKNNINVTIRRKLGSDIDAACGQLRNKRIQ